MSQESTEHVYVAKLCDRIICAQHYACTTFIGRRFQVSVAVQYFTSALTETMEQHQRRIGDRGGGSLTKDG